MRSYSLTFFFIFFANALFAQSSTESKEILLPISAVQTRNDSVFAAIRLGTEIGIKKGDFGKTYNIYRRGQNENYTETGICNIIESRPNYSLVYIQPNAVGKKDGIQKNDMVALNLSVPKSDYNSIIFDLAAINITFTNISRDSLYSLKNILYRDSKQLEDSILNTIVLDIKETYEMVKDMFDDTSSLKRPLEAGRYKGKSVINVMKDVTVDDVRNYLMFVKSFPFKYMGYDYKANETFATWVLNFGLTSADELEYYILKGDKAKFQQVVSIYKKDIVKDKTAGTLSDEAVRFSNKNDLVKSKLLLNATKDLVELLNDTLGKASYYLNKAQIYQDHQEYTEAIKACDEAIKYAFLAKNTNIELQSIFKKAFCQYKISNYKEAAQTIAVADKKLSEYQSKLSSSDYLNNRRKKHEYSGWIQYYSGDYQNALSNFRTAININNELNTFDAKSNNASNYWFIGKALNKQSNFKEALSVFDTSYAIYKSINQLKDAAFIVNEIGYTLFKMKQYDESIKKHNEAYETLVKENDLNNAGYSLSMVGQNLWNLQKYKEAIESHQKSIALRKKINNAEGQAFSWSQLGELYKLSGEKTKALASYDSAAYYYTIVKDSASIAENFTAIGKVYEGDNDVKTAIPYYEKALQYVKGSGNKATQIDALFNLGLITFDIDTTKSKKYFNECLTISQQTGDKSNQLYSLVNLGALAGSQIKLQQSYYEKALALSKEINTPDMMAYCYSRMSIGLERQLDIEKAFELLNKSISIYDTVDKKEYIKHIIRKGHLLITKGDFNKAQEMYESAIQFAGTSNNKLEMADALNSISFLYRMQGEFTKGMAATDSAASIYRTTGNKVQLAGAYESWGNLYTGLGNYAKAITSYLTADSIYTAEKKEYYRDNVNFSMGVTYFFQADYKKSLDHFLKSEAKQTSDIVDEYYLLTKSNIAECYYYLKQLEKAEQILKQYYNVAKEKNINRIASSMAIILGRLNYDKNQLKEAGSFLQMAKDYGYKSGEKEKIVEAVMYLGMVENKLNNSKAAEENLKEATTVSKKYNINSYGWEALYELGLFYYNNNKLNEAIVAFKDAVNIVENNSDNVYGGEEAKKLYKASEKKVDLYSKLVGSLAKAGQTNDAWAYANKSNIAALKDLQGNASLNSGDKDKTAAITHANELLQQKAAIDKSLSTATEGQKEILIQKKAVIEKEYLNYINSLIEKYPDLELYFARNVNPEQFKNYKDKIPKDAAALLYLVNEDQLLIFTVTNEKIGIKILELKEDLNKTVGEFINALSTPNKASGTGTLTLRSTIGGTKKEGSGSFADVSENLYNILIGEVADEIKGKKKLCIIPNGKLSNIPFQVLGKKSADSSFHFLVEDYAIFYTNTLDIFKNEEPGKKAMNSFIAFGNPDKTLNSAKQEVLEIGKLLNVSNIHTEDNATEQKAKKGLSENKYVHFATHGILDYTDFSQSYLKFAVEKTSDDDGKLTLKEIKELDITGCDLVTLSACETAVTKEVKKGWYVSPANSLLINRVKSVVASLWSVDDVATSLLMKEFYKNIQTMDKVEALRKAQATLSKDPKFVHPFYWGAFVLYGDWR